MITLIGTGHVFDLAAALLTIFDEKHPDLICVELDNQRYHALMLKNNNPEAYKRAEKNVPFMYRLLARFQESMASEYGVIPGAEMLAAITYAQTHQLPVEFIDMNAQHIFTNMWKSMKAAEKLRLMFSGFAGLFISKKTVEKELKNMQNNFDTYLDEIGKKFPTIKRTLIDERNIYMTNKLISLHENHTNIVACVGDGHIIGMTQLLQTKQIPYESIRLNDLQNMKPRNTDGQSASFTIDYKPV